MRSPEHDAMGDRSVPTADFTAATDKTSQRLLGAVSPTRYSETKESTCDTCQITKLGLRRKEHRSPQVPKSLRKE